MEENEYANEKIYKLISIVVPCYNEEEAIPLFYNEIRVVADQLKDFTFEFLFIDDGSEDRTMAVLADLRNKDKRVRYISFSRNFGKEAAIFAGFEHTTGDYIAVMDADLQDPPSLLPEMLHCIINEGCDCAATRRVSRKGEPPIRSFFANIFYRVFNKISHIDMVEGARDFRLMKRQMVEAIKSVGEYNRFSKGIYQWVGFKTKWFEYENLERVAGKTKWSFWKLYLYSIDGMVAYSTVPLAIASLMGIIFCLLSFIMITVIVIRTLIWGDPVSGWPSLASLVMFMGGIQLLCIGIIGQYLAKTYLETKRRPIYIKSQSDIGGN